MVRIPHSSKTSSNFLAPEYLPDTSPSGSGFPQLSADRLDVVVILGKHPSEILEHFHPLQHVPMDGKLLPEGQCRRYRCLPLLPPLNPDRTFLRRVVPRIKGVDLHPTLMASPELPLGRDYHQVHRVDIPKMPTQVPAIVKKALAHEKRASQFAPSSPMRDGVGRRGPVFQQLLGDHLRLEMSWTSAR
jgi:hypothetical protein